MFNEKPPLGQMWGAKRKDKTMPNSRKGSKKHRGAWLEPNVIERLREIATAFDTDFTGLLEKIGKGEISVTTNNNEKGKDHE